MEDHNLGLEKLGYTEESGEYHDRYDVIEDPSPRVHPLGGVVVLDGL